MTEPAQNYRTGETASIEGLEDLFGNEILSSESVAGPSQDISGPSQDEDAGPSRYVSALEASLILGINKRSVIRLINEQKLDAIKENGKYLIDKCAVERRKIAAKKIALVTDDVALDIEDASPSRDDDTPLYVALDIEDAGPSRDDDTPENCFVPPSATIDAFALLKELEGATFRIGYLEAQLAERDQQIRLLTDSQHNPGWWARFKKWCAGG
jgi:hypothetical protein